MARVVFYLCLVSFCLLIRDSNCLPSQRQRRGLLENVIEGNKFSHGKFQQKRQDPPPPPPPEDQGIWNIIGKSRRDFIEEHRQSLTASVRTAISNEMNQGISALKDGMEYMSRALSCMVLSQGGPVKKRTVGDTLTDIERNITDGEQQEEKDLKGLLESLDVDMTVLKQKAEEIPLPRFLEDCMESPLIMRIDNEEFDKTQELATCSWLLMNKVNDAMEEHDEDTVESFVDKFEAFLKGMFRFFQLYDPWATEVNGENQQSAPEERMLKAEELRELKRMLENTINRMTNRQ
uniref:Uncharacterized protein LOC111119965 n=1 Tax=Crassostrea virginica TaxID=6565 RepID=A0A8B8CKI5_CRAVI|nr:uncharacterized protein LOC111119965 [Crassostrea virginica]